MQLRFGLLDNNASPRRNDLQQILDEHHREIARKTNRMLGRQAAHVQKGFAFIIAYVGKNPVGYVEFQVMPRKNGKEYIGTYETRVIESMQRKGIATQLAQALIGHARSRGISFIYRLNQTPRMIALAKKMKANPRRKSDGKKAELFRISANERHSRSFIHIRKTKFQKNKPSKK